MMSKRLCLILALMVTFLAANAFAQQDKYVRLRYVEGDVTLFPADGQRSNDATVNSPIMNNDELTTGNNGRAELSYSNGIVVRVGGNSAIRITSAYSPMTIDLLQGTLFVDSHMVNALRDELMVQAGTAQVFLIDEGNMRVDLSQEGTVRVTSNEGEAEIRAGGNRVLLNAGERTYIDPNSAPEAPQTADKFDDLDDWNVSRMEIYAGGSSDNLGSNYVDESIYYDAQDLDNYGDWQSYGEYGNVWVPQMGYGWRPYNDGRWQYADNSWFWVGYEPWGWAPYRYGRWGWGYGIGWYWIPGTVFGPAWVSWYDYGNYIGWCPLDYWNNPIYYNNYYNGHYYNGGYWNPIQKQKTLGSADSWTFVKKTDLGASNARRVSLTSDKIKAIPIESRKVTTVPSAKMTSYVLPASVKTKSFVNEQRTYRETTTVKNPAGVRNTETTYQKRVQTPTGKDSAVSRTKTVEGSSSGQRTTSPPTQNWENERKSTDVKKTPITPTSKGPYYRQGVEVGKDQYQQMDRDKQFERNSARSYQGVSPYGSFSSPYYRSQNQFGDGGERRTLVFPDRNSGRSTYYTNKEMSPRYVDEARKFFGTFDGNRQAVTRDSRPDSSTYKRIDPPARTESRSTARTTSRPPSVSKSPSISKPSTSGYRKPPR